jgi:kynurenine formamidase
MTATPTSATPTEAEVLGYFSTLSNWGRWGAEDQLGTLNLVTPAKRKAAAALVQEGITVSCAWDIETTPQPDHAMGTPQRFMVASGDGVNDPERPAAGRLAGALEFIGMVYHGYALTHVDGLCHIFWDGKLYNGQSANRVTTGAGATHHAITVLRDGVMTRGVLLDIAASKNVPWLEPGYGVGPDDLEAAERRQGLKVEEGDVVLLRTGYGRKKREQGRDPLPTVPFAGWHAAALPWLRERGVAMIGCDTAQDMHPAPYPAVPLPVHAVGIVAMGLWLIDNCNLEELGATCERLKRWSFQFVLAPLRMTGGTGSPANPIAVF